MSDPVRSGSRYWSYLIVSAVLGVMVAGPVLVHGIPDLSNDGRSHAAWVSAFSQQFWGGELYPRWLVNINAGYGSPAFFFYSPFHAFSTILFWPFIHQWDPHGWFLSGYSCVLGSLLSGVFAFLWIRRHTSDQSALIGAVIYLIAPYHLCIDLYNRGAAAEFWLFAWLPLVMICVDQILSKSRYGVIWLALSYALCILSHAVVSPTFAAVPMAYALFLSEKGYRIRSVVLTAAGLGIGVGLCGVFLLPAALDQWKMISQTADWADYRNWWLFNIRDRITEAGTVQAGVPWYLSFKMRVLVITLWMVAFCFLCYWFAERNRSSNSSRRQAVFYLAATLACFFLMLQQSAWVWMVVPILKLLQLPLRLNTIIVMAAAMLGALAWENIQTRRVRWRSAAILLSMGGWLILGVIFARQAFSAWRPIPPDRVKYSDWAIDIRQDYSSFRARFTRVDTSDMQTFNRFIAEHPPQTAGFTGGAGSASILNWRPRRVEVAVNTPGGGPLVLNQFYYDGWTAYRKDNGSPISVGPSKPYGLIELSAPPGNYTAIASLPLDTAERQGLWVSLASLAALAGWAIRQSTSGRLKASPAVERV